MRPRLVTAALTGAAALAGSLGTRPASDWYESLDKPDWQPPHLSRVTGEAVKQFFDKLPDQPDLDLTLK